MSRNALKGTEPQTYLDDLESFYYVLLYLTTIHMDTKFSGGRLPSPLTYWDEPTAYEAKSGFIPNIFDYDVDPRLGKPFQTLVERLHAVFRNMLIKAMLAHIGAEPPPVVNHEEVYSLILSHVCDAIDDLNRETQDGITTPCQLIQEEKNAHTLDDDSSSFAQRRSKNRERRKIVRTLATNRARRLRPSARVTNPVRIRTVLLYVIRSPFHHTS